METTWEKKTEFVYEMMWLDKNFTIKTPIGKTSILHDAMITKFW